MSLAAYSAPKPIGLAAGAVHITLATGADVSTQGGIAAYVAALPDTRRIYLVLGDLRARQQPGTLFHIFLDFPPGPVPGQDDPRHLGAVNFFSAVRLQGSEPGGTVPPIDQTLDVTDALRTLAAKRQLREPITLTFIATSAPEAGSNPTISRIELIEQ